MVPVFYIALLVVAVEATTEIVTKSAISEPLRNLVDKWREDRPLFKYITTPLFCPHCFSVWAAILYTYLLYFFPPTKYFLICLLVHRLSNYLHMIVDRMDKFYLKKE